MRQSLLSLAVIDVVYYTHLAFRNTLMASGDFEFLPYVLLLDATVCDKAATPKELAHILAVERIPLEQAGDQMERDQLVTRTRSPLDRRSDAYVATLVGRKHAIELNHLMWDVCRTFWMTDDATVTRLINAVEPFHRVEPRVWFTSDDAPVSLQALCSVYLLWRDYQAFSHSHMLTLSEMHILLTVQEQGPHPDHILYRSRNQFAINDYASLQRLSQEKGLLEKRDGLFRLTERGERKLSDIAASCSAPTRNKQVDEENSVISTLVDLCMRITRHAMSNAADTYGADR